MESHKPMPAAVEPPRRSPLLLIFAVLALVAAIAAAFYLGLQKSAIQEEQKTITADISSLQTEITDLEGQNLEAAQLAQQWLAEISKGEILWSGVITRIKALMPVDPITQKQKIKILSYSGSESGKLLLNAETVEAQLAPYEYVSELLSVFNNNSYFEDAYIPSITQGETDQGLKLLSFVMDFSKKPEESIVQVTPLPAGTQQTVDTSTTTKVPRQ